jgi:KUP system potassium uptake protein
MSFLEGASNEDIAHVAPAAGHRALTLAALGVVYGDIGTSPIYALRETVRAAAGNQPPTQADVIGALSIILWSLTIVVSIKYALFVLRADNRGEGGTLSIMALARNALGRRTALVTALGMIGASLFIGDAVITPAISVLSAVEGLHIAAPALSDYVVPIAAGILATLFGIQRFGTDGVARAFWPVMLVWFAVLAATGALHVADAPRVFLALNPLEAVRFLVDNSGVAFAVIGASFLAVTGAEALYVDLGHFGKRPILTAWFGIVFPCLLLNYFGQGAYLLNSGQPVGQPLFEMVSPVLVVPLVILATLATVIASQAVISGTFSLVRQATQLQLLPRFHVIHTSATQAGQIYLPSVNWLLLAGVLALVLGFGSSEALADAYGLSVTGEMLVTTLLLCVVMVKAWRWPVALIVLVIVPFALVDLTFLAANILKIPGGGWVSVWIACTMLLIMRTWMLGSSLLFAKTRRSEIPLDELASMLGRKLPHQVPGTAVFLTSDAQSAPTALLHSLKHYKVLHENNIILTVTMTDRPKVNPHNRVQISPVNGWLTKVSLRFGYMEDPNVPRALALCRKQGLKFDIMSTSFFLSRRSLIASQNSGMPVWQDRMFIALARGAADASSYFRLPTGRVVEIGTQVVI